MNAQLLSAPADFELPDRVAENIPRFTGRAWLLPELIKWWRGTDRFFVLKGGPGSGKSMISGWLAGYGPEPAAAEARQLLHELRSAVAVVHFCQANSLSLGPRAFAEAAVNQLLGKIPAFENAFLSTRPQYLLNVNVSAQNVHAGGDVTGIRNVTLGEASDSVNFNNGFIKPLRALYQQGYSLPLLVIIDALDEEVAYDGAITLAEMLTRTGDLPEQVKFLVTTRDDDRVTQHFGVEPFDLISNAPRNVDDVHAYAVGRMRASGADERHAVQIAERVAMAADGVFLYAAMVLDDFAGELLAKDGDADFSLPHGLPGLYRRFLQREVGVEDKGRQWQRIYRPLLGCIAVAQGSGITARLLEEVVGAEIDGALEVCKQYLAGPYPAGPFRVFHKSFADFLLEADAKDRYSVNAEEMHSKLATLLWSKFSSDWSVSDEYTRNALAIHLTEGKQYHRFDSFPDQRWLKARSGNQTLVDFGADVDRIWQATRSDPDREHSLTTGFRCALLRGSINANARNYPIAVLKRALELDLLSAEQLFSLQNDLPELEGARLAAAMLGSGKLKTRDISRAYASGLARIEFLPDVTQQVNAFAEIAKATTGPLQDKAIGEALHRVSTLRTPRARAHALQVMADAIPVENRGEFLKSWMAAIEEMPESEGPIRANGLKFLAPYADEPVADSAWSLAKSLGTGPWLDAGVLLLPRLSSSRRAAAAAELFKELLATFDALWNESRANAPTENPASVVDMLMNCLRELVPYLQNGDRRRLSTACAGWEPRMDPASRFRWAIEGVALLEPAASQPLLEVVAAIDSSHTRLMAYGWLRRIVSADVLAARFERIRADFATGPDETLERLQQLNLFLPFLPSAAQNPVRREMLQLALAMIGPDLSVNVNLASSVQLLKAVFAGLDAESGPDAVELAVRIGLIPFREELFAALAPRLDVDALRLAVRKLVTLKDSPACIEASSALARRLDGPLRERATQLAIELLPSMEPLWRARSIAAVLPALAPDRAQSLLREAIDLLLDAPLYASISFEKLAPFINGDTIDYAKSALERMRVDERLSQFEKAACQAILASRMPPLLREDYVTELLQGLHPSHSNFELRLKWIAAVANEKQLSIGLEMAIDLRPGRVKALALLSVTAKLRGSAQVFAMSEFMKALDSVDPLFERYVLLGKLASQLEVNEGRTLAEQVLQGFTQIESIEQRALILVEIAALLEASHAERLTEDLLRELPRHTEIERTRTLEALIPLLGLDQLVDANRGTLELPPGKARIELLTKIGRRLVQLWGPREPHPSILHTLGEILMAMRDSKRAEAIWFVARALQDDLALSNDALGRLFNDLDEIINRWSFDVINLPTGPQRVH
jgi:hypothetical protein